MQPLYTCELSNLSEYIKAKLVFLFHSKWQKVFTVLMASLKWHLRSTHSDTRFRFPFSEFHKQLQFDMQIKLNNPLDACLVVAILIYRHLIAKGFEAKY